MKMKFAREPTEVYMVLFTEHLRQDGYLVPLVLQEWLNEDNIKVIDVKILDDIEMKFIIW